MIREVFNKFTVMELLYNIEWSELLYTWQSVVKMLEERQRIDDEALNRYEDKAKENKKVISKWKKPAKVSDTTKKLRERIERGEL